MSLVGTAKRPFGFGLAAIGLSLLALPSWAADYDQAYAYGPPRAVAPRARFALDPRCRMIPQPELNLYGDTTRFRPTIVCMSRGLLADSFGPYPFGYPYYDR